MRPGPLIRRSFGPYERAITEVYRGIFTKLDDFIRLVLAWVPRARRILEVGCGEGAITERLVKAYPDATVTGIDITPNIGRLYRGDPARVSFLQTPVGQVAGNEPGSYDLVVLCDVLHHVRITEHLTLLSAIDRSMSPEGSFVFKDWTPSGNPIHWLCELSDRYLTGDDVHFLTAKAAKELLAAAFGAEAIRGEAVVRPWSNNIAYLIRHSDRPQTNPE
jgi:2-polyprenyl-3-methyl-5-hydroxy-6-metoxy-1,4-benzoquinol methylase